MSHIYVCSFSSGTIKVGRSIDPKARISAHADRVACVGVGLLDHQTFQCVGSPANAEYKLIQKCSQSATSTSGREWFLGLDFSVVCDWAEELSKIAEPVQTSSHAAHISTDYPDELVGPPEYRRYVSTEPCGPENNWLTTWVDNEPNKPHWPDSAMMRWDLKQSDWHRIWPDLISHPCAFLFAPKHPHREGGPKFSDWVSSWINWPNAKEICDELPIEIADVCKGLAAELRPDDYWLIWPDLKAPKKTTTAEAA